MLNKNFSDDFVTSTHMSQNLCCFPILFIVIESAPPNMQLELIELPESSDLKSSFRDLPLDKFCSLVPASTYPTLRKHGSRMASLFGSTYICEKTFSVMNFNKTKYRTALTDEHLQSILQISATQCTPRYEKLIGEKSQLQSSTGFKIV